MTAAHDNTVEDATTAGGGATVDVGKDRVASDEEFWVAFMREKGAWKETERRLRDR